jgi:hypothetical protein
MTVSNQRKAAAYAAYERWRSQQPQQELLLSAEVLFAQSSVVEEFWTDIANAVIDAYNDTGEVERMAKEIYTTMIRGRPYLPTMPFEQLMDDDAWKRHLLASARRILGKD